MGYLFEELAEDAILTGTNPHNRPSVRLLGRLGLKRIDQGEYRLSRDEWVELGRSSS